MGAAQAAPHLSYRRQLAGSKPSTQHRAPASLPLPCRLSVMAGGLDARLLEAATALHQLYPEFLGSARAAAVAAAPAGPAAASASAGLLPVAAFLWQQRAEWLAAFATTLDQDARLLEQLWQGGDSERLRAAVRLRMGKKRVLLATLCSMGSAPA